jgi:hypothetical protein
MQLLRLEGAPESDADRVEMGRSVLAVLAGLILTSVVIFSIEFAGHAVHPFPEGVDPQDPAALREFIHTAPAGVFFGLLAAWVVGTAAGSWLAARLAHRARKVCGWIIGGFITLGAIAIMTHIPHPVWLWVLALLAIPGAAVLGTHLAVRGARSTALPPTVAK